MGKNKVILFLFLILVLSSFVYAVPPFNEQFIGDVGMQLEHNIPGFVKLGSGGEASIYVYNKSDGKIMTNESDGVKCFGNLYLPNGSHIKTNESGIVFGDHFHFDFNSTDITLVGVYSYQLNCYNEYIGGFISGFLQVTETGLDPTAINKTYFVIALLGIVSIFFVFGFTSKMPIVKFMFYGITLSQILVLFWSIIMIEKYMDYSSFLMNDFTVLLIVILGLATFVVFRTMFVIVANPGGDKKSAELIGVDNFGWADWEKKN